MTRTHSTLPYITSLQDRKALSGALTFLELASMERLEARELSAWFDDHLVKPGCLPRLDVLTEPPTGSVSLRPAESERRWANATAPRVAAAARERIINTLRGLLRAPADDQFLRAFIFAGRVQRDGGRWMARPERNARLSDMVLSLFCVSILEDRALYDHQLCVCEVCGRVSFDAQSLTRETCPIHQARWTPRPPPPSSGRGGSVPPT